MEISKGNYFPLIYDILSECYKYFRNDTDFNYASDNNLIEILKRNQRMKDSFLQEIEDLQDTSKELDLTITHQSKEIEKLETFINSETGLNQKRVSDLEAELATDERNIDHLLEVIEELKAKVDIEEANVLQKDIELCKKVEDVHDLNIKLTESTMDFKQIKKKY